MSYRKNYRENQKLKSQEKKITSRRSISRILLLNGVLLAIMFILYESTPEKPVYQTTVFEYQGESIRFSLSEDKLTNDIHLNITFTAEKNDLNLNFNSSAGEIFIKGGGKLVTRAVIGENIGKITLRKGSVRTFTAMLKKIDLIEFAKSNPDMIKPRMKIRFFFIKRYIPLEAIFKINGEENYISKLKFSYKI